MNVRTQDDLFNIGRGSHRLVEDVTLTRPWRVPAGVVLYSNGRIIDGQVYVHEPDVRITGVTFLRSGGLLEHDAGDCLSIGADNIRIMRCSFAGALDENVEVWPRHDAPDSPPTNVLFWRCAFGLARGVPGKQPRYNMLIGEVDYVALHECLFYSDDRADYRSPVSSCNRLEMTSCLVVTTAGQCPTTFEPDRRISASTSNQIDMPQWTAAIAGCVWVGAHQAPVLYRRDVGPSLHLYSADCWPAEILYPKGITWPYPMSLYARVKQSGHRLRAWSLPASTIRRVLHYAGSSSALTDSIKTLALAAMVRRHDQT